jgi:methylase of polypeptide subunit release factors
VDVHTALPRALEEWLRAPEHPEVEARWVPGLDKAERKAVHAVGGVARLLLAEEQVQALPDEVRSWMLDAAEPPSESIDEVRTGLKADPDGTLAALYATIVRSEHRRQLGTFFTPSNEVGLMLDLWTSTEGSAPKSVIDVGAGVGVFTAEAAKRWPEAQVYAVDINPVTLGLLAVRLFSEAATSDAADLAKRVKLVRADYTEWLVSDEAPEPGERLILGNPPYTRAQLLSLDERVRLRELTNGLCGTRASLSTLITALSLQHLAPTDGLSLLLPAQWLESQYARDLRMAMWEMRNRRIELRLIETESQDLFDGALVDAVALLIGAETEAEQTFRIARWGQVTLARVDRAGEVPASWRSLFESAAPANKAVENPPIPLSKFASVHRGVATGSNATFVLLDDARASLPGEALTRVITRVGTLPDNVTEHAISRASDRAARWLLTATEDMVAKHPTLKKLVDAAEALEINKRLLCSRRKLWYDLTEEVRRPDVIIGAMTKDRFKLVKNSVGATITNNLYGISWNNGITKAQQERVLTWLRSDDGQAALKQAARRQGAGLLKLEPGGLRQVLIPAKVAGKIT